MTNHYCKDHPDFEGLDMGKLHDHIERDHSDIQTREQLAEYFQSKHETDDFRRSDGIMIRRTWGKPPVVANFLGVNEVGKK